MKRKIFAGLAVAGAVALWTGVGSLAHDETPSAPETAAIQAAAAATTQVNGCETTQTAAAEALAGQATGKDPEAVQELVDETVGQVQDIASNARDAIDSALSDFVEQIDESTDSGDQGATLTIDQFTTLVNGIATKACADMQVAVAAGNAQIASLEKAAPPDTENDNEQGDGGDTSDKSND